MNIGVKSLACTEKYKFLKTVVDIEKSFFKECIEIRA